MKVNLLMCSIVLLLFNIKVSAQSFETYIKHNYDEYVTGPAVTVSNNQFVIGVRSINTPSTVPKTTMYLLDSIGSVQDSLELSFSINSIEKINNKISFVGSDTTQNGQSTISIGYIKIQGGLDTTIVNRYLSPYKRIGISKHHYINYCNCFIGVGLVYDSNSYSQGMILQWDTNMNSIKQKYYSSFFSPVTHYPIFYNVIESLSGNNIAVLSSDPLDSTSQWRGGAAAIVPMDSMLRRDSNQLHLLVSDSSYKFFTGNVAIKPEPYDGIQLTDTSYLFAGRIFTERFNNGSQVGYEDDLAYTVTDTAFNSLKWHFFGKGGNNVPDDTIDLGSSFMVDKYDHHVYIGGTSDFLNYNSFFGLTKIDLDGNHLWTKYYQNGSHLEFVSVTATHDGGVLLLGRSFDQNKGTGFEKDIYILKVDSNGNMQTVGLEEKEVIDQYDYSIYPNPARNELNFRKFNHFNPYKVKLYDAFGREVKEFNWNEDMMTISIGDLASGVYIYRITDEEGRTASGKVVKE